MPAALRHVLGLVFWRNQPLPVIDLDVCLGLTERPTPIQSMGEQMLIIRGVDAEHIAAVPIRPGVRVVRLPIDHQPVTDAIALDESKLLGAVQLSNETLAIPNIDSILN